MSKKSKKAAAHKPGSELLENPDVLAEQLSRSERFIEEHKVFIFSIAGIIALVITGFFLYNYYIDSQNDIAQNEMYQAVYYFENDSLDLALRGDGNHLGLLDIIDDYGSTPTGNLANFYAGVIYIKKGNLNSAIPFLEDFSSDDYLLQARAYSLLGDIYMDSKEFETAAALYDKAADNNPNEYFTPQYLMKSALAYELLEKYDEAAKKYDLIIEKFGKSVEADKAKKYKAKLLGNS